MFDFIYIHTKCAKWLKLKFHDKDWARRQTKNAQNDKTDQNTVCMHKSFVRQIISLYIYLPMNEHRALSKTKTKSDIQKR